MIRPLSDKLKNVRLARTLFDHESVVRCADPQLERTEKARREKVSAARGGLQPLYQVYTARYLSRVCLKKCAVAETRIQVIALRRLLRRAIL